MEPELSFDRPQAYVLSDRSGSEVGASFAPVTLWLPSCTGIFAIFGSAMTGVFAVQFLFLVSTLSLIRLRPAPSFLEQLNATGHMRRKDPREQLFLWVRRVQWRFYLTGFEAYFGANLRGELDVVSVPALWLEPQCYVLE